MRSLLAQSTTARRPVFGASDVLALGAMEAARSAGLSISRRRCIVGFDDIPVAKRRPYTVRQPEFDLGTLRRIRGFAGCNPAAEVFRAKATN